MQVVSRSWEQTQLTARKEMGPQSYNYKEVNSANKNKLEEDFFWDENSSWPTS